MADATLAAKKSTSFNLVEKEISNTIELAELSLERFQVNRESGEDLQNCIDFLNQLRGIFTLIELEGGTILCQESVAIATEVPVGASEDKNSLLASLSQALFVLRRYVEYFDRRREDHPELLLAIINNLRTARQAKTLPDSYFFDIEIQRVTPVPLSDTSIPAEVFEYRSRRLRHMFQVGLLYIINVSEREIGFKLINRSAEGFQKLCRGSSISELWSLAALAADLMLTQKMELGVSRRRLFMTLEKYTRELVKLGKEATAKGVSEAVAKELIYIIAVSGDQSDKVREVLAGFQAQPSEFDDAKLVAHRSLLKGPGSDVLSSLAKALREEINHTKDKLDTIERGTDTDDTGLQQIAESLGKLADTLIMLDLRKLSELARGLQSKLHNWSCTRKQPDNNELVLIADSVLNIEQAISQLEDDGLTVETDKIAEQRTDVQTSSYLAEANIVVVDESRAGLSLAKRAITAYLESSGDKLHLANVQGALDSVLGAMIMTEQTRAAKVLKATACCIEEKLLKSENKPEDHLLETLADALTSLEYYVDSLERNSDGNAELMILAEEAVASLGY